MSSKAAQMAGSRALQHKLLGILNLPAGPRSPSILLADDDPEIRELLASELRKDGYRVMEAEDGNRLLEILREALDRVRRDGMPDVIVLDNRMPGRYGLDVLDQVRKEDWWTPVVLITGFGDAETLARAGKLGVTAVFDKPFNVDDLRATVLCLVRPPEAERDWLSASGTGVGE